MCPFIAVKADMIQTFRAAAAEHPFLRFSRWGIAERSDGARHIIFQFSDIGNDSGRLQESIAAIVKRIN